MDWRSGFISRGVKPVLLDSLSATFFAPNPNWLRDNPNWITANFISIPEQTLLYPGMALIIISTPFFLFGSLGGGLFEKNYNYEILLLLIIFIVFCLLYTAYFGSISGRYRIQLIPIFYIITIYGFIKLKYIFNEEKFYKKKNIINI
jgi:hypothetical protein